MISALVVFVWAGAGNPRVDHQVEQVMRDVHVERASLPAAAVHALAHHSEASRDLVKKLHADGVIVDSRPGRVRLSPHWCVTEEELERGMDLVFKHLGAPVHR